MPPRGGDLVSEPLYLEDIFVGQRFVTGTYTMTAEAIKAFARDYDPQSFHTDELAAKDSFFADLAASGWHTAAITMRLQIDSGPKIGGGMIGASGELSWPIPTRPGDVLHVSEPQAYAGLRVVELPRQYSMRAVANRLGYVIGHEPHERVIRVHRHPVLPSKRRGFKEQGLDTHDKRPEREIRSYREAWIRTEIMR